MYTKTQFVDEEEIQFKKNTQRHYHPDQSLQTQALLFSKSTISTNDILIGPLFVSVWFAFNVVVDGLVCFSLFCYWFVSVVKERTNGLTNRDVYRKVEGNNILPVH